MTDIRVLLSVPAGVIIRTVEGGGGLYQEIRVGDKMYRVEGHPQPHIQMEGWFKRKVVCINNRPVADLPCCTVYKVRRGFSVLRKACPDCGHRDGWFALGILTGAALVVGSLAVAVITQPPKAQPALAPPAPKSWFARLATEAASQLAR